MSGGAIPGDRDEPLLPPWPSPEFRRLNRRQSLVAWTIGGLAGLTVAAAVIVAVALALI